MPISDANSRSDAGKWPDESFWLNRRVLVTGHSGFKGCYLASWLAELGADVVGYAHAPVLSSRLFKAARVDQRIESITGDIRDCAMLEAVVASREPEVIFHLAAESLVLGCLKDPVRAFETNVQGTVNLLQAARRSQDLRSVVVVTSDKCYAPANTARREGDVLGGDEPYSASKACADIVTHAFQHCYLTAEDGIGVATARAGNVIGGGDFAQNRLIPDLVRGAQSGTVTPIRHPQAVRPWQHVLDALSGYLLLAEHLANDPFNYSGAWNFGPAAADEWPVARIADAVCRAMNAGWRHEPRPGSVENPVLRLDSSRSRSRLGWRPRLDTARALAWTIKGYSALLKDGGDAWLMRQIGDYEERGGRRRAPELRAEPQALAQVRLGGAGHG